jgi:hypothetical protein
MSDQRDKCHQRKENQGKEPSLIKDYDQIVALQKKCFPEMLPWSKAQFSSIV